jgi:hypothetical protein
MIFLAYCLHQGCPTFLCRRATIVIVKWFAARTCKNLACLTAYIVVHFVVYIYAINRHCILYVIYVKLQMWPCAA